MSDSPPFAHLHCHSHYSLLDGANRIPNLGAKVKADGMNALALTDHGNLFGAVQFYNECRKQDINPVLGYEAYVAPGHRTDRTPSKNKEASYHLTLLARNRTGFQNLMALSSLAYLEGFYYKPRIDKEILEAHSEGLICLSGCASSELSHHILAGRDDQAAELVSWYQKVFGENLYLEIQNAGLRIQQECLVGTVDISRRAGIPLVATTDSHYLDRDAAEAHGVPRVVVYSSVNAMGYFMGEATPDYLPFDEDHPCRPGRPYGIAKYLGEQTCRLFTGRTGVSTVSIRPPAVWSEEDIARIRAERARDADFEWGTHWEYGCYIHVDDLARATLCALTCPDPGHVALLVVADDISSATDLTSRELARKVLPEVAWRGGPEYDAEPYKGLVDNGRAKEILGWAPQYRWRD